MSLSDNTTPVMAWTDQHPPIVKIGIVCHCGKRFSIHELDVAHAHVRSHLEDDEEPS